MAELRQREIIQTIIEDVDLELTDEEVLHLILDKKVSHDQSVDRYTFGQKAADKMARFAGSWYFIGLFALTLVVWIWINAVAKKPVDPFPFILLNLMLSCIAAIQAPLIMMSQNRQEEKDRLRAENDYRVNLKTEIIIQDIHHKLDLLLQAAGIQEEENPELPQDLGDGLE